MTVSKYVANQLGNPTGIFGKLAASIWNRRNAVLNDTAFELLELIPTDRVLDIGFGGGYLLDRMATRVTKGWLVGVDISPAMVANAEKRYHTSIQSGKIELKCATVESLPYPDQYFSKVCSINSIFYWQDIKQSLVEIRRVLEKDGKAVLCFTDKGSIEKKNFSKEIKLFDGADIERLLIENDFQDIENSLFADRYRQYHCVTAKKP
jgi:ubiquinone/menaquinone biosynthesis C-methylase UbiE